MPTEIIEGLKCGTKIYFCGDGHYYHANRRKNGKIYLRCIRFYKHRCHGRAVCSDDLSTFRSTKAHAPHRRTKSLPNVRELRRKILDDCSSRHPARFTNVVWKNSQGYSRKARSENTAVRLRGAMRRARGKFLPDIPLDLESAHEILSQNSHVHRTIDGKGYMYAGKCGSVKGKDLALIFISNTMKEAAAMSEKVFADGTEDGTPSVSGCKQIYSITTTWDSQRKTERSYTRVLRSLKLLVPDFHPSKVHCDFETAISNSWKTVFPDAIVEGCLFHYAKAISEYARSLGLSEKILNDITFYSIVRSCLAIPMVKKEDLMVALLTLMKKAHRENILDDLKEYFEYLYNEWVTKRKEILSVWDSEDRTNNVGESWNSKLQSTQEEIHPNFFRFTDTMLRLEEEACQNIYCLKKGKATGRPRKVSALHNDTEVQRLTRLLYGGNLNMAGFLRQTSFRILAPFSKIFPRDDASDDSDSD